MAGYATYPSESSGSWPAAPSLVRRIRIPLQSQGNVSPGTPQTATDPFSSHPRISSHSGVYWNAAQRDAGFATSTYPRTLGSPRGYSNAASGFAGPTPSTYAQGAGPPSPYVSTYHQPAESSNAFPAPCSPSPVPYTLSLPMGMPSPRTYYIRHGAVPLSGSISSQMSGDFPTDFITLPEDTFPVRNRKRIPYRPRASKPWEVELPQVAVSMGTVPAVSAYSGARAAPTRSELDDFDVSDGVFNGKYYGASASGSSKDFFAEEGAENGKYNDQALPNASRNLPRMYSDIDGESLDDFDAMDDLKNDSQYGARVLESRKPTDAGDARDGLQNENLLKKDPPAASQSSSLAVAQKPNTSPLEMLKGFIAMLVSWISMLRLRLLHR